MAPRPDIGNQPRSNDTDLERTNSAVAGDGSDAHQGFQRQIDSEPPADDHGRGDDK